jgi:hypothetical protein
MEEMFFAVSLNEIYPYINIDEKKLIIKNEKTILKKIFYLYKLESFGLKRFMKDIKIKSKKSLPRICIKYYVQNIPIDELLWPLLELEDSIFEGVNKLSGLDLNLDVLGNVLFGVCKILDSMKAIYF